MWRSFPYEHRSELRAYLGFIAYLLDVYVESDPFNGATKGDIKLLMHYVWELANNENAKIVCSKYQCSPPLCMSGLSLGTLLFAIGPDAST